MFTDVNDLKFNVSQLEGDNLILTEINNNVEYRLTKYTEPIKSYSSNLNKNTSKPSYTSNTTSTKSSSDNLNKLKEAVIIGGGLMLLNAIFGGDSNAKTFNKTDRMMRNWKEQDAKDRGF